MALRRRVGRSIGALIGLAIETDELAYRIAGTVPRKIERSTAIKASVLMEFLDANGVRWTGRSGGETSPTAVAKTAIPPTVMVECVRIVAVRKK